MNQILKFSRQVKIFRCHGDRAPCICVPFLSVAQTMHHRMIRLSWMVNCKVSRVSPGSVDSVSGTACDYPHVHRGLSSSPCHCTSEHLSSIWSLDSTLTTTLVVSRPLEVAKQTFCCLGTTEWVCGFLKFVLSIFLNLWLGRFLLVYFPPVGMHTSIKPYLLGWFRCFHFIIVLSCVYSLAPVMHLTADV
jgi:hypothetical protein